MFDRFQLAFQKDSILQKRKHFLLYFLLFAFMPFGSACMMGPSRAEIKQADALKSLGLAYSYRNRTRLAIKYLLDAEKLNPYDYWTQEALGGLFFHLGKRKESLMHYEKALKIKPKSPRSWNNLGIFYVSNRKYDKAVEVFEKGLRLVGWRDPCDLEFNLGRTYFEKKSYENALKYFQRASRNCQKPRQILCGSYFWIGKTCAHLKRPLPELIAYQTLVQVCVKYPPGYFSLAQALHKRSKFQEASKMTLQCLDVSQTAIKHARKKKKNRALQESIQIRRLCKNLHEKISSRL